MNKKTVLIMVLLIFVFIILIVLGLRKGWLSPDFKKGKTVSSARLINRAREAEAGGNMLEAKNSYQALINNFPNAAQTDNWEKKVEEYNIKLLFSPAITVKSALYEIKSGDTLAKIAREFKTTTELIMRSNNLTGDRIVPGRKIKVSTATFSIVVDKSQNILILKSDEDIFKTYVASTGANNSTPVGTYKIVNKLKDPTWFKSGAVIPAGSPKNDLGSRWLGFDLAGYGIHGTTDPQSLGKQVTQGCVRLANSEVEELYSIVPEGTEVIIVD